MKAVPTPLPHAWPGFPLQPWLLVQANIWNTHLVPSLDLFGPSPVGGG